MVPALVFGTGAGLGVVLVWTGLLPRRLPLVAELARLRARPTPPPDPTSSSEHPRAISQAIRMLEAVSPGRRADLAITGSTPERLATRKLAAGLAGLLLVPVTVAVMAAGSVRVPLALPLAASLLLGAGGLLLPDVALSLEARTRRRDFSLALSSFLDLTAIGLAGGAGPEGALRYAARVGEGWAFSALDDAIETTRVTGEPAWSAFGRLAERWAVPELAELAASLTLAGTEGARVRESLVAKAESLRRHHLADAEARANEASERMALPLVLLFLGFLVLIAYPAISRIVSV